MIAFLAIPHKLLEECLQAFLCIIVSYKEFRGMFQLEGTEEGFSTLKENLYHNQTAHLMSIKRRLGTSAPPARLCI